MEKKIVNLSIIGLIALFAFTAGYCSGLDHSRTSSTLTKNLEMALDKAEIVIDNNNLYDTDGSDAMSEYLEASNKVHTLYSK